MEILEFGSLMERLGDLRQIAGAERLTVREGPGAGNEVIQVRTGGGMRFEVNLSRGGDIGLCELYALPVSWLSSCGRVPPHAYNERGTEWNRGFEGGLLATCGLQQAGKPCVDQDEPYGQHGRVSYLSAQLLRCELDERRRFVIKLAVRETKAGGENLLLTRTITAPLMGTEIFLRDEVRNEGWEQTAHLMLYHFNFGYPLISETTAVSPIPGRRTLIAGEADPEQYQRISPVSAGEMPDVILHHGIQWPGDDAEITLSNRVRFLDGEKIIAVRLRYDARACPFLTQWRHQRSGVNVLALEPGSVSTRGRAYELSHGGGALLAHGETRSYGLSLNFSLKEPSV